MKRSDFKALMQKAFGGGFRKRRGLVTAGEVSASLVRELGFGDLAASLNDVRSPDGWDPQVTKVFGTEVVSRELGLRRDHATSEEGLEADASSPFSQADVAWAVWQAKTSPDTYTAGALSSFRLSSYSSTRRRVVRFALSLVGAPYVWGGEWATKTGAGYPYGAQAAGGFDCTGFIWYVMQKKSSNYSPGGRSYQGWSIPQRVSSDMAKATKDRLRLRQMKAGDVAFFAPNGRRSKPSDVYHAGIYLGGGWMIHSSGGRAGISLAQIGRGAWWHSQLLFGRRIIP